MEHIAADWNVRAPAQTAVHFSGGRRSTPYSSRKPRAAPGPFFGRRRQASFNRITLDVMHRPPFLLRITHVGITIIIRPEACLSPTQKLVAAAGGVTFLSFHKL